MANLCSVCDPKHATPCRLSHAVCPYRDIDTKGIK